jgi:hypothetical protein
VSKLLLTLRRFSLERNQPKARWDEKKICSKIHCRLSRQFLTDVIGCELQPSHGHWQIPLDFNI